MNVRKATRTDSDAILDLLDQYDRQPDPRPMESNVDELFLAFDNRADGIFVVELDGAIVGTFALYICPDLNRSGRPFAVAENVIVSSAHRRQGIGRAMMNTALHIAEKAGCHKIMLQSGNHRIDNHLFYESCGFRGDKRGFYMRFDE